MGRFLITSLPRGRTAWLAALLCAHGIPCLHEPSIAYGRPVGLLEVFGDGYQGIVDPGATVLYRDTLKDAFAGCPTVLIRRNSNEAREAFSAWLGKPVQNWDKMEQAIAWFEAEFKPLVIDFADLDHPEALDRLFQYIGGPPLNYRTFSLFDTLKIEQHRAKADARLAAIHQWPS